MKNSYLAFETASLEFIEKARSASKASDAEIFFSLAERSAIQALDIWRDLASNSILLWMEIAGGGNYASYCDFCARNGLEVFSEADFGKAERVLEVGNEVTDAA